MLNKELELVQTAENKIKKAARKIFLPFAGALFPIFVTFGMLLSTWRNSEANDKIVTNVVQLTNDKTATPEVLNKKLDILLTYAKSQIENQGSGFALTLLTSVGLGVFVMLLGGALAQPAPSFIVISKASEKNKIEVERKINRRLYGVFGSMILTVVLGLIVNYVYDKMK